MSAQSILQVLTCWHELQDSLCDSTEGITGENNDASVLIALLAALFQVPKHELFRSKVKYIDELLQPLENEKGQQAEEDLPQINQSAQEEQPYRKLHSGVNKTPLHTLHNGA